MPLNKLIDQFNAAADHGDAVLAAAGGRVVAKMPGLQADSTYQPIVALERGMVIGHVAFLSVRRDDGAPLAPEALFAQAADPARVVRLDRLVRTLHTLNFLAQRHHAGGYLYLQIHPRHLRAVPSRHGLVFEAVLKRCGLGPDDIFLEVDAPELAGDPHVHAALAAYRQRGYHLALDCGRSDPARLDDLLALRPEVVKLDFSRLAAANLDPVPLVQGVHAAGAAVVAEHLATAEQLEAARRSAADLAQGTLIGPAAPACVGTHQRSVPAYTSAHFSPGVAP